LPVFRSARQRYSAVVSLIVVGERTEEDKFARTTDHTQESLVMCLAEQRTKGQDFCSIYDPAQPFEPLLKPLLLLESLQGNNFTQGRVYRLGS
jgi:hypothetical protein